MRALGVGALVAALAALAAPVQAEPVADEKTPYALAWVRDAGAEGCPAGRDFADEVTRRLGRSPFDARAERSIEIRVDRDGALYRSRVVVRERDGRVAGQRVLSSPNDCTALFSATALAVALLIDPEAALHTDAGATGTVAPVEVLERPAPSPPPPEPVAAPPPPRAPTPAPTEPQRPPPAHLASVSARATLAIGVVPGIVPGAELFVSKRLGSGTTPELGWSASALYLASGDASAEGTTFDVGLTAFGLAALLELIDSQAFTAGLDAGLRAGALRTAVLTPQPSKGTSVVATDPGDFFYLSLGTGLHAEARLARWLLLDAQAGALFPLIRRRLEVTRASTGSPAETPANTEIWLQPAVGALGAIGLGVPFP